MELNGKSRLTRNHSCQMRWPLLAVLAAVQLLAFAKVSFDQKRHRLFKKIVEMKKRN